MAYLSYILRHIKKLPFENLLDVGCGDGKFLFEAQKYLFNKEMVGIDFSKQAVAFAQAFSPNITFYVDDIANPLFVTDRYGIITLIEVLEHIPPNETEKFLKGVHERLADDGYFIITVPSDNIPVGEKYYRHFNIENLKKQ